MGIIKNVLRFAFCRMVDEFIIYPWCSGIHSGIDSDYSANYSISFTKKSHFLCVFKWIRDMNYYIFGAHSRGYTLFEYLRSLRPQDSCIGFLYDNDEINPTEIEGVIVTHLANNDSPLDTSAEVYIATRGVYHDRITNALKSTGFRNIIRVTPEFDTDLRNNARHDCDRGKVLIQ